MRTRIYVHDWLHGFIVEVEWFCSFAALMLEIFWC